MTERKVIKLQRTNLFRKSVAEQFRILPRRNFLLVTTLIIRLMMALVLEAMRKMLFTQILIPLHATNSPMPIHPLISLK